MNLAALQAVAERAPERAAVVSDEVTTWSQLVDLAAAPAQGGNGVVGLRLTADGTAIGTFLARAFAGLPTALLPPTGDVAAHVEALQLDGALTADGLLAGPGGSELTAGDIAIVTSGTTGAPKVVRHSLESLVRPVRGVSKLDGTVWLATYPLGLYAGLQVLMHVLLGGGTLVAQPSGDVSDLVQRMVDAGVTHVSATPSWWRRLLLFGDRAQCATVPLKQATLGGEVSDQPILDGIRRVWPTTGLAHIYATSELGRCFSVRDGRAGFPAAWLSDGTPDGVSLRVEEGQLLGKSPNRMRGYAGRETPSDWVHTGDLVEVTSDRVRFIGRLTERINVGGNKVDPFQVEGVLRTCPELRDVRVFGKRSSIAGEIVAAEIVAVGDPKAAKAAARAWALAHLTEAQRPRSWRVVEQIATTAAGKRARRQ